MMVDQVRLPDFKMIILYKFCASYLRGRSCENGMFFGARSSPAAAAAATAFMRMVCLYLPIEDAACAVATKTRTSEEYANQYEIPCWGAGGVCEPKRALDKTRCGVSIYHTF